jgi:hypothetical protein
MGELKWFISALLLLWVLWVLSGGPSRYENKTRPFLEQPAPIETGRPYTFDELKNKASPKY